MSQHDYDIANQTFPNTRADWNALAAAIATCNSGASLPAVTQQAMLAFNTTDNKLYQRNEDNTQWMVLGEHISDKWWPYQDGVKVPKLPTTSTADLPVFGNATGDALIQVSAAVARTNLAVPGLATANAFTADQSYTLTDDGAAAGPLLNLIRNSATPAVADALGALRFVGKDSAAADTLYARLRAGIVDPVAGSQDGAFAIDTIQANVLTQAVGVGAGVWLGGVSGGDKGLGTINVTEIYKNGSVFSLDPVYRSTAVTTSIVATDKGGIVEFTTGGVTANLGAAATLGAGFRVTLVGAHTSGDITIDPNGAETLDGLTTRLLRPGDRAELVSTGTGWRTVKGRYSFESAEQSLALGTLYSVAHGLGMKPTSFRLVQRCKITEQGWSVGDEMPLSSNDLGTAYGGMLIANASAVEWISQQTYQMAFIRIRSSPGSSGVYSTAANWRWVAYAVVEY